MSYTKFINAAKKQEKILTLTVKQWKILIIGSPPDQPNSELWTIKLISLSEKNMQ